MPFEVTLSWNADRFVNQLVAPAVSDGLNAAAGVLETTMKKNIVPRGGPGLETRMTPTDKYPRKGAGGGYVSDIGMRPTTQTGVLRNSIQTWGSSAQRLMARVGTTQSYGKYLEHGTSQMRPRPFVYPSLVQSKQRMHLAFLRAARARMAVGNAA
jgi:HK97 gp10 family phage protein